jgi:hypothetical protein
MKKIFILVAITTVVFMNSCTKHDTVVEAPKDAGSEASVALGWYNLQLQILLQRNSSLNGLFFGYIGIGLYEAVRYEFKNSVSLSTKLYQMPEMPAKENTGDYDWQVSANAEMAAIVRSIYTGLTPANLSSIDSLENAFNQKLKPALTDETFNRSQAFGKSIATAIYNWYLTDHVNTSNTGFVPAVFSGSWVPTPPAFANGINPYISSARPFVSENSTLIAPAFPASYSEDTNSDYYKIAKSVYDVSQTLTTEQKNTALFWVDQGDGIGFTPPGHDMSIVAQALEQTKASLGVAAEAFAKAGIAERDASIACFRSKYAYSLCRPVTYIRKLIDPNWLPFIPTPPHPEYPAAHALVTGSVMEAVTKVVGDNVGVTDHSYDFRGWTPRTFTTLFKAAEEAGISRQYGGIHYLPSINAGLSIAKDLGDRVGEIQLH